LTFTSAYQNCVSFTGFYTFNPNREQRIDK
jgi:hypothetical protein